MSRSDHVTLIIGLTGGIASGKNFVADIFARSGAAVFDADKEVHEMLATDKSVIAAVRKNFSESIVDEVISRKILGQIVFSDPTKLRTLEKILHVRVRAKYHDFLQKLCNEKKQLAVLNIPLLLESGAYKYDKILAVLAPKSVRKKRFLARVKGQNLAARFEQIYAKQMSDRERKARADFVVNTGGSKVETEEQVLKILQKL